ncbi:hypothetical protein DS229_28020, partial [Salmonella enterica subsp. enterica serovar Larochelle]|nr:hypothetical protein [Salmonella enterica subsp. enterica serovar Larochelle]
CDICHIFDLFKRLLVHFVLTVLEQAYTQCGILFISLRERGKLPLILNLCGPYRKANNYM